MWGADLTNAQLCGARLVGTDFSSAKMQQVNICDTDLRQVKTFVGADLFNAEFSIETTSFPEGVSALDMGIDNNTAVRHTIELHGRNHPKVQAYFDKLSC